MITTGNLARAVDNSDVGDSQATPPAEVIVAFRTSSILRSNHIVASGDEVGCGAGDAFPDGACTGGGAGGDAMFGQSTLVVPFLV